MTISNKDAFQPMVAHQIFEKAQSNENWKLAFATGKNAQIVFMNISPDTNPENEIGVEIHPFDQVIVIAEGHAKVVLDGEVSMANAGDMIFIPQGTTHNVINLGQGQALKIISFYSDTDIPANSIILKKGDESEE